MSGNLSSIIWTVVVLGGAFALLLWQRRNPYVVTRIEMKEAIERVLAKKMPAAEWNKLVRTPMKRDRYLNSLREKIAALPRRVPPAGEDPPALYEPAELTQLAALLEALVKRGVNLPPIET